MAEVFSVKQIRPKKLNVDGFRKEVLNALRSGLIRNPSDERFRNAQFIVQ